MEGGAGTVAGLTEWACPGDGLADDVKRGRVDALGELDLRLRVLLRRRAV